MDMEDNVISWNGYSIYRISKNHINDLISISESAFNLSPPEDYYINKNLTDDFGPSYLGFIAFDSQSEAAAFYGVYSCQMILDGKVYSAVQSGDTMTHKNHTGKGLFIKLASLTYELCSKLNISFVFGFPNYNSYPGFVKKLNWTCPGNLKEYRVKVFTLPLLKLAKKVPLLGLPYKLYLTFVNYFFSFRNYVMKSSVICNGVGGVHRTTEFMNYKFKCGKSFVLAMKSGKVWLKADGYLILGDAEPSENKFNDLVNELKRYAFIIGADEVIFQTVEGTHLDSLFSQYYTSKEALPYGYLQLNSSVDPSCFKYVMADLDTF